jgi:hypothetical protein
MANTLALGNRVIQLEASVPKHDSYEHRAKRLSIPAGGPEGQSIVYPGGLMAQRRLRSGQLSPSRGRYEAIRPRNTPVSHTTQSTTTGGPMANPSYTSESWQIEEARFVADPVALELATCQSYWSSKVREQARLGRRRAWHAPVLLVGPAQKLPES